MINLENIYKSYSTKEVKTEVLKGIDIKIEKGDFVALMGPSGCGKSTLLNILGKMDSFDDGEYLFENRNVKDMTDKEAAQFRNEKMGFIFQAFHLINDMTAVENVEMPMGYAGVATKERKMEAISLLEKVGLKEKAKNRPSQLSGGQQQRVAIARALANKPMILLADEPTGNLDYEAGMEIMEFLKKLNKSGMTIVMVTHDNHVAEFAQRQIRMWNGKFL